MLKQEGKWTACDLRVPDTSKRLWTLTEGKVKDMQGQLSKGKPPTDLFQ